MKTTLGQILLNEALPEELRDYKRVWDRKTMREVLRKVATETPEKYAEISHRLLQVGQSAATTGNFSFSLKDFVSSDYKRQRVKELQRKAREVIDNTQMTEREKHEKLLLLLGPEVGPMVDKTLKEHLDRGSRLAELVHSGSRGSPGQFNTTVGTPLFFMDMKDDPIPVPIFHSVAEGLDPAEYWASSYGTRKGGVSTKFAVQEAGYFSKKLALAAHRNLVTEADCGTKNGIAVDGDDPENVGTILQLPVGDVKANTLIKPEHLKKLAGKKVVVRSPITCQAEHGLCSHCAGIRETGAFPEIGDNVSLSAAMAFGERLSQSMLNVKHQGGVAKGKEQAKNYGFQDIERLFEMPQSSLESATLAEQDGIIKKISPAPAGGVFVMVNDQEHWVPKEDLVSVKQGDHVEAGDLLSKGIPNPRELARHRGIGAARMQFLESLREMSGKGVTRRNGELLARAMVSHVQVTDSQEQGGTLPGDVVRYDDLVRNYKAREEAKWNPLTSAHGQYLEQPVLHYTIGTKINNRVILDLKNQGLSSILTHKEPPPFEPDVQRMYAHSQYDPDWMTRLGGYGLKAGFLEGVHRGETSETPSTSFVPGLAKGVDFGKQLPVEGKY